MPHSILTAAIIPLDIKPLDSNANVRAAIRRIEDLPTDVDIAVLPEMFNTGFTPDPDKIQEVAQFPDGAAISQLREAAHRHSIAICGSYMAKDHYGHYY
ncbi:MAG: hypothetical protein K2J17_02580, partial [Paramuribaculum sp.]|nr:hypothetical protein [Paramuribaculum sp.]